MKKYLYLLFCVLTSAIVLSSCQVQNAENISPQHQKIPVVTTKDVLTIHTKMIAQDDVFAVTLDNTKKYISNADKELILWADVIIGDTDLEKSRIATTLQNYKGTYLNVWKTEIPRWILSKKDEISNINAIRDVLGEINPARKWNYYDNAGNYVHLLNDTYEKLLERIQSYNQASFLILWANLDNFLEDFWLKKYSVGTIPLEWKTKSELVTEIENTMKAKKVSIIFVDPDVSKDVISELNSKTQTQIYVLVHLDEDTSAWGYIRYIEKMINIFVSAFDTYD